MKLILTPLMIKAAQKKAAKTAEAPVPRPKKFLPGETRATVGSGGFHRLNAEAYMRRLYSNAEPRNLTKNSRVYSCPQGFGPHPINPQDISCATRTYLLTRHQQLLCEQYINKLLCNLHCAAYRKWSVQGWTWHQATTQQSPQLHEVFK